MLRVGASSHPRRAALLDSLQSHLPGPPGSPSRPPTRNSQHWWMDSTDFSEMTGVLADGKVDILFAGHWRVCARCGSPAAPPALSPRPHPATVHRHYYQRMLPLVPTTPWKVDSACASADNHTYVDPLYTTMIVSGAVGDVERNDSCPGDASLNRVTTACSAAYGYGIVTVQSATELRWDFSAWSTPIGDTGASSRRAAAPLPARAVLTAPPARPPTPPHRHARSRGLHRLRGHPAQPAARVRPGGAGLGGRTAERGGLASASARGRGVGWRSLCGARVAAVLAFTEGGAGGSAQC